MPCKSDVEEASFEWSDYRKQQKKNIRISSLCSPKYSLHVAITRAIWFYHLSRLSKLATV